MPHNNHKQPPHTIDAQYEVEVRVIGKKKLTVFANTQQEAINKGLSVMQSFALEGCKPEKIEEWRWEKPEALAQKAK
ncbi:hypothetical protein [Desulfovibrio cuneatus]|uniref:hypothetical protein n=1 Tax=Desulfovibrio cuneatus TaxID=159728 RepID=UPI0003FBE634|nr:hypothetical protein [Desulfovibrio cuneatus]